MIFIMVLKMEEKDSNHFDVQGNIRSERVFNKLQSEVESIIPKSNLPLSEFLALFTTEEENYIKKQ